MAVIQIIAGPPGIGKSTLGSDYVNPDLDILNEDDIRLRYKTKGYADYNEYSIFKIKDIIRHKLIRDKDFALELNLGFQHQYDYILSAKKFNPDNKLHVILFFTDILELCLRRAKERHESGLHLVRPEIITEMYQNTIPLFKSHFDKIDCAVFIDADINNVFSLIAIYQKAGKTLELHDPKRTDWFNNDLRPFIESKISA